MSSSQPSPGAEGEFIIRVVPSITEFGRDEWDELSGASRCSGIYNPFISHAFLGALERSGSATRETGWLGQHLRLEDAGDRLIGAAPCYLKSHSQGEYVFDHGWADAFERAGGRYYPKLQVSVPFTPATGPRLLVRRGLDATAVRPALAGGLALLTERLDVSSAHVTFAPEAEIADLEGAGFLHRTDQQFHFVNDGYRDYADFLDTLTSRKRKALRKERTAALADGIGIERLTGTDLTESVWDTFFSFYMDTGGRKWGRPYLTRRFFSLIGEVMADDIVLVMAKRDGRHIAGALNFVGSDTIFGRHWGCVEHHRFLHFELCYHQAIDYAIDRKLKVVEAGAQGEHKLARGYVPVTTHSAHFIPHAGFRRAVDDYLRQERHEVERIGAVLGEHTPFRKE
ncbi:MAG: GNAT family N-acetyltransferase [Rhizobiaceae bacterium]